MPGITALTLLLIIFAVGELIAKKSNAIFSTVLVVAIILMLGFWTDFLPETIFADSGIDKFGNIVAGILITSLGTTMDFPELKRQWKVVAVSLMGVSGAVCVILIGGVIFGLKEIALAGAPVFAGGSAATLIIMTALKELNMQQAGTFCIVLYVMQKFIGIPIASACLRREAGLFRKDPENITLYTCLLPDGDKCRIKRKLMELPDYFSKPSVYLAKLAVVAMLSYYLAKLTNGRIHYFVMCLLLGIVFYSLGFLDKGILQKTQSDGIIIFLVTIIIFSNFAATTLTQVIAVIKPLSLLSLCGVAGVFAAGLISSLVFRMRLGLTVSLGITCTFGFPTTMLMPKEIAQAVGETEEEKTAIENYLLPKMLTAGLVTVTIASVLIAGAVVNLIK